MISRASDSKYSLPFAEAVALAKPAKFKLPSFNLPELPDVGAVDADLAKSNRILLDGVLAAEFAPVRSAASSK